MIDKKEFLSTYNMTDDDISQANITWDELMLIVEEYAKLEKHLRDLGKEFINDYLYDIEKAGIHSYRYRTKSQGHLLEKIIRKRKEDPEKFLSLNHTNFYKYMTDLIGIRVFYLYREDWTHFDYYITSIFENNPENYKLGNLKQDVDYSNLRWTVDEKEDFILIKKVYEHLYDAEKIFLMKDILQLLDDNPSLLEINDMYERNEGLQKSLDNDEFIR